MESIHVAIEPLLKKAKEQATDLALLEMTAQIEAPINKAMKAAGLLNVDPEDEALNDKTSRNEEDGGDRVGKNQRLYPLKETGEPAKEIAQPTGVRIEYVEKDKLEGRAFGWDINGKLMTIKLEKEMFSEILGWPPKMRDKHVVHLVVSFLSHAFDMLYWDETENLRRAVSKSLYQQIEDWASQPVKIAPYLYKHIISSIVLH
jgi:hypothetical protein